MKRKIVCVGNLVHDEVFHVDAIPAFGVKTGVLDYDERFGGPAATAAIAIARLGGLAAYWGRVGADAAGEKALGLLRGAGVDCAGVAVVEGARTLRSIVLVDRNGERAIVSDRRAVPSDPDLLPDIGLDDAGIVLADSRWAEGAERVLRRARALGVTTVLDADGGPSEVIGRLIELTDHVVFSAQGLRDFAGDGPAEDLLRRCAAKAPGATSTSGKVLAATQGPAGSLWLLDGEIIAVPAFPVQAIDTTGCGDVFHGAYALGLVEGLEPVEAARFAAAEAALKAANGRGWDGMPERPAVEALLAGKAAS